MTKAKRILGISDSQSVFVPEWQRPEMFELIVRLAKKRTPRICYLGAARGDDANRIAEFFELAHRFDCDPFALKLFSMMTDEPSEYFKDTDVIFIDGGATRNLIALMREWDAIEALKGAYESGVLIVGASAGISMLFDWCISDSIRTRIAPVRGIGVLPGTVCAHYDVSAERRDALMNLLQQTPASLPAYGISDGMAVLFVDGGMDAVFATGADSVLYYFSSDDDGISHGEVFAKSVASKLPEPG